MKKRFKGHIQFIPFCGIGIGTQKSYGQFDIIMLLPFIEIQFSYIFTKKKGL